LPTSLIRERSLEEPLMLAVGMLINCVSLVLSIKIIARSEINRESNSAGKFHTDLIQRTAETQLLRRELRTMNKLA